MTFKYAPSCYKQVVTIHGWFMDKMFSCVYILLKNKDEFTYKKMIMLLRDRLFELGFNVAQIKIETDFELAEISAFRSEFIDVICILSKLFLQGFSFIKV